MTLHTPKATPIRIRRRAFSAIELLIVIAIIGVIMSLLVPAVQRVRGRANAVACMNNLRQIALASHQHHDSFRFLPSNGGWDGKQVILSVSGQPTVVYTYVFSTGQQWNWGVGDPSKSGRDQTGSWAYSILPFIEQEFAFRERAWGTALKLYACPQRREAVAREAPLVDEFGQYCGAGWTWAKTDYAANAKVIANRPHVFTFAAIKDGLSNTVLFGEKSLDPFNYDTGSWYWDEPYFLGGSGGTQREKPYIFPDQPGVFFQDNWGSAHSSAANFAFADASVRTLRYETPAALMSALLSPQGGESIPPTP